MNKPHRITQRRLATAGAVVVGLAVVLAAVLLAIPHTRTAVSPSPSLTSQPSTSQTATPTASPTPARAYQALVVSPVTSDAVQGHSVYFVYDSSRGLFRQIPNQIGGLYGDLRFAPGDRLSVSSYSQILTMAWDGGAVRREAEPPDKWSTIGGYAWSPSGSLAYLVIDDRTGSSHVGQVVIRPVLGTSVQVPLGIVSTEPGHLGVRFSPDGTSALVETGTIQVRRLDGSLVFSTPGPASDATWTRDGRLYFQDARGVNVADLRSGATSTVLPGVRWFSPSASPDGRWIVFESRDGAGTALRLLDVAAGKVNATFSRSGGRDATFVAPSEIWFREQDNPTAPLLDYVLNDRTVKPTGLAGFLTDARPVDPA